MEVETFGGKKIKIRKVLKRDLQHVEKFQDFINSLIQEDAKITLNKKVTLLEETKWLEDLLRNVKLLKEVFLLAECDSTIVGTTAIKLNRSRQNHVGMFGITIRKDYRGIGLGDYLTKEIIKLARKELKPAPKIIRLSVFPNNKPAINLYKKFGFKKVATIPKQFEYEDKLLNEIVMLLYL